MADLDDFFAKKDRKRNKGQKKTDEGVGGKKETARERPRPRADGEEPRPGEEEEWKEYEETVKDYTGLKIQVLQGGAGGGGGNSDGGGAGGEDTPSGNDHGKVKGPWNKADQPEVVAPPAPVEEAPPRPRPDPPQPNVKSNAYVPPAGRRPTNNPEPERRRQQSRHAPDIHNDDYFPVLGSAANKRGGGGGGWSTAAGQPAGRAPAQTRRPLALDNRFTSLQDDS